MALVLSDFYTTTAEEEKVYVAVAMEFGSNESTLTLWWAIQRFRHRKLCILHVHHPSHEISQEQRDMEEAIMSSKLDEYVLICKQSGIEAEKVYLETDSIEQGILKLISQHKIQNLIMGAAADQNYDLKMIEPKSRKAIYVKSHAPPFCHIWFICKGNLVCTREAKFDSSSSANKQEITTTPQTTTNFEAVCRADALENLYTEELRKRKEIEAELQSLKDHHDKTLAKVVDQKLVITKFEQTVTNYEQTIKQLEDTVAANAELVKLREEERDKAVKLSRELIDSALDSSTETILPEFFLTIPSSEILNAASESDQSTLLLYEGELGNIYKAVLYHTEVSIRFFPEELLRFQHEVKILSQFRHPNLATLIGASPEIPALVYEHLPNGTLEDRLRCKGDTRPLSWQTRIKIAIELCSALIFLHSHGVIHGALRPSCVLFDSNFSCKIIDLRFSRTGENSSTTTSVHFGEYTDPEFLNDATEPYPRMDVYSYGLMLLELLTGKPGFGEVEQVRAGLDEGTLDSLLDTSAGDWPMLLAEQLAHLGLSCCSADVSTRPCLKSDAWKVLEPMRLPSGSALSFRVGEAPSYFVCPILQEVMEDPHVATDGYTYEAEALRQWLDRGNETSPMTNLELDDTSLVPNRALRSAIQEWQQLQRQ